ncbi:hypothetical protein SEA_GODONK_193 [Gordonia phage GodonK]|uniref:Uncharacterized protein n=1 Tax=Gordonia phage GodonK TaxID=2562192 RepID=A0A4D6E2Q1_9CAUD|nr:hypothetical protein HOV33_gp175 [Gordonia phage GodonK]QBZ72781.1 hypothetical protein SEA_GODONK_193 [Gordonia phage GodonK]
MSIVVHTKEYSRTHGGELWPCRGRNMFGCNKKYHVRGWKCGDCQTMYHDLWKTLRSAK